MSYLLDTNILLRSSEPSHPMFTMATTATSILLNRGEELYITPQNLIEFWNVCTRPKDKNGLGYSIAETKAEVEKLKTMFPLLPDISAIYPEWERLVSTYQVKGVNVHDARLVAAMLVHGITHILTFNVEDFRRYAEINPVNPGGVTD
ncbi:twitching motility protein PilT [[Phormidium ambiguum] IAM M-71]|uniref:Twitching motility protein PilT n=1 Tax=[Phormidium ambiguum] IAM M-71 TaxID=454136 RepID=A0A1U7IJA2_9CYAN|nr:type II toxin-antitoxin system VapC family toxin [Phormidium ambiguum]OKH37278.1 twitching motility protein PilT [Phormidium ambiguum IAM M-71]